LTEEQRLKLIKYLNQIIEDKRNQIRRLRDEARKTIKNQFEEKNISEDERFRLEKQLDEKTKNIMERIEEIKNKKVNEISTL
jgi:ribosome recycling factor